VAKQHRLSAGEEGVFPESLLRGVSSLTLFGRLSRFRSSATLGQPRRSASPSASELISTLCSAENRVRNSSCEQLKNRCEESSGENANAMRSTSAVEKLRILNPAKLREFDAKRLFAPVADKGGGHTEADEHATRNVTFPAQIVPIALDPPPRRAGDQCIKSITRQAHQCKQ